MARDTVVTPKGWWLDMEGHTARERFVAIYMATSTLRLGAGHWGLIRTSPDLILGGIQPGFRIEHVEEALDGLEAAEWLVRADGWFFIPEILRRDYPRLPKHVQGAANDLAEVPRHSLVWLAFLNVAHEHAIALYEELDRRARGTKMSSNLSAIAVARACHSDAMNSSAGIDAESHGHGMGKASGVEGTPEGARDTTLRAVDPLDDDENGSVAA